MKSTIRNYHDENDYWRIRQFLRQVMILNDLRELSWGVPRLDYRRDLDLVAAAGDGIAALTTFWYDDVMRTVYIEPVATVPEHQRKGPARALITEGLRQVQRLEAVRAFVGGYEPGPDAIYASVLSPVCDRSEQWVRER